MSSGSLSSQLSSASSVVSSLAGASSVNSASLSSAVSQASVLATALSATLYAPSSTLGIDTAQVASEQSAFSKFQSSLSELYRTASVNPTDAQTTPGSSKNSEAPPALRLKGTIGLAVVVTVLAAYGAQLAL